MVRNVLILLALATIIGLPFVLKPKDNLLAQADETLVVVTPHIEAIRYEFARGFRDWYKAKTGKVVRVDWRVVGGTTEIARYLASSYQGPFENVWRFKKRMHLTDVAQRSFDDPKIKLPEDAGKDTEAQMARRAFLDSDAGIGVDLFFGGGSFDFAQQAAAGRLVDSGFIRQHPEIFGDGPQQIPQSFSGEPYWDPEGKWMGAVLSSFGICYNDDSLRRLGMQAPPQNWADLGRPEFLGEVAVADPNMSGVVAKTFEMIVQQQIAQRIAKPADGATSAQNVAAGWDDGMRLIQRMGANTRYFTDLSAKMPIDVSDGNAAVGMSIDFYGRFQAESDRDPRTGLERMHYFNPPGGTSIGVDPIGLLRGAPHRELALAFIEYVMSVEGQKLWDFKLGAPGGPQKYVLRRSAIRRELYGPEFAGFRADPTVNPYDEAKDFTYHPEWTAALFGPLRFIVRVMCIDPHEEADAAWRELIRAKFPPEATRTFADVTAVSYEEAKGRIAEALKSSNRLSSTRLAATMTTRFREQYKQAGELARAGK